MKIQLLICVCFFISSCAMSIHNESVINDDICKRVCTAKACSYEGIKSGVGCLCGEKKELK